MSSAAPTAPRTAERRIEALRRSGLLDLAHDPALDRLTRLAAAALRSPTALVTLVDRHDNVIRGCTIAGAAAAEPRGTTYEPNLCRRVAEGDAPVVVPDMRLVEAWRDTPAVRELGIVAYLGVPLRDPEGHALGTLAVTDRVPRDWGEPEVALLGDLATAATVELALRAEVAERRRVEAALRESEARLEEAQRVGRIGSWSMDAATGRVHWSRELYRLSGLEPREAPLSLDEMLATVHPEEREAFGAWIRGEMARPGPSRTFEYDYRTRHPDGTVRVLHGRGESRRDADGRLLRAFGTAQDVTDEIGAEASLRESEARFRELAERAPIGVYIADTAGRLQFANSYVTSVLGRPMDDLAANGWFGSMVPADRDRLRPSWDEFVAGASGDRRRTEFAVVRPDGEGRHVVVESVRVRDAEGATRCIVGSVVDVTEQRHAEEALRASEARFRGLIENASDMISVLDADGVFRYASPALRRFIGFAPEDLVGHDAFAHVHPDDVAATLETFTAALARPGEPLAVQFRYAHAAGGHRTIACVATNLLHDPAVAGVVINSHDVTEAVELAEQLRQAQKMDAIGRLAGGVAHDFNNLLLVIGAHVRFAMDALPEAHPARGELVAVDAASARAAALTRQLLAFSRKQLLKPEPLDLNHVVAQLAPMLQRLIGEDILVRTRLEPALGTVLADPTQVEQVLVNLAVNARDAMPSGGRLTLATANVEVGAGDAATSDGEALPPGSYVRLVVSDTGTGMDEATRARVFEPFFTTREPGKGTGLGLSTVHGIVRQSGGAVRVWSAPGRGSTFVVDLPRVAAPPRRADAAAADGDAAGDAARGVVLLVEDEPQVRAIVRRILARHGFEVLEAASGEEALALALEPGRRLDLVITDVVMPGMSGRAFADHLAAARPGTRVLFMSGYTDDEILRRGLLAPGTVLLEKPFGPDRLLAAVRAAMEATPEPAAR